MEKINELSPDKIADHAGKIADGMLNAGRRHAEELYDKDNYGAQEHLDKTLHNANHVVKQLHDDLKPKEYAKAIIHSVADHSHMFDGKNQDKDNTRLEIGNMEDLDGEDVLHHHAISAVGDRKSFNKIKEGIGKFDEKETMEHLGKIEHGINHTEDEEHATTKELHNELINHAMLTVKSPKLNDHIISHMNEGKNKDYYADLLNSHHSVFDQLHPAHFTSNPRVIHTLLDSDSDHYKSEDALSNKDTMEHIGKHADSKLANHIMHHEDAKSSGKASFVSGLNKNPNGEAIQHDLTSQMHLPGGSSVESGKILPVKDKSDLRNIAYGRHRENGNADVSDNAYSDKFEKVAQHTKFKSVYDKLKGRTSTDLNNDDLKSALKKNPHFGGGTVAEVYTNMNYDSLLETFSPKNNSIQSAYIKMNSK
jgi:hypothetical protein